VLEPDLKKKLHNYEKSSCYFLTLKPFVQKAIENARELESFHDNDKQKHNKPTGRNPSTTVYKLIEQLI
jgi:hypothetical protein